MGLWPKLRFIYRALKADIATSDARSRRLSINSVLLMSRLMGVQIKEATFSG